MTGPTGSERDRAVRVQAACNEAGENRSKSSAATGRIVSAAAVTNAMVILIHGQIVPKNTGSGNAMKPCHAALVWYG